MTWTLEDRWRELRKPGRSVSRGLILESCPTPPNSPNEAARALRNRKSARLLPPLDCKIRELARTVRIAHARHALAVGRAVNSLAAQLLQSLPNYTPKSLLNSKSPAANGAPSPTTAVSAGTFAASLR